MCEIFQNGQPERSSLFCNITATSIGRCRRESRFRPPWSHKSHGNTVKITVLSRTIEPAVYVTVWFKPFPSKHFYSAGIYRAMTHRKKENRVDSHTIKISKYKVRVNLLILDLIKAQLMPNVSVKCKGQMSVVFFCCFIFFKCSVNIDHGIWVAEREVCAHKSVSAIR